MGMSTGKGGPPEAEAKGCAPLPTPSPTKVVLRVTALQGPMGHIPLHGNRSL